MSRIPAYEPQLAQLIKEAPPGPEWLHELKYDGYRIGCRIARGAVTLLSRNGKDWTEAFPEIAKAAAALPVTSALIDGEVCVVLPDGRTSFQALQNRGAGTLTYFAFDLLHLDGRNVAAEPLHARKLALKRLLRGKRIQFSDHLDATGPDAFREACRLGLEGIISKRRDDPYQFGKRTGWLKTKCIRRQEFVIGGFTDPEGSRQGVGALLVGYYAGHTLVFAGKVGTGFTVKGARDLRKILDELEVPDPAFGTRPGGWLGRNAHWVTPSLVGEVTFAEWTDDGKIRHPSFQGLRKDRAPESVVREEEQPAPVDAPASVKPTPARKPTAAVGAPASAKPTRARKTTAATKVRASEDAAAVRGIRISHPDRVMYESPRITKIDVARYYDRMAAAMMPHVEGRPLTLVRCGEGLAGGCFYMKHSKLWSPEALRRVKIREKTKVGDYLVVESPEGLISLAQMSILEIHTWNTRYGAVETPDRIVIDLDPGPHVPWPTVVTAARQVRRLLHTLDLESFVKTTGGKGLHVVIPLAPKADWEACLQFARAVAEALTRRDPELFTTAFAKRGRERQILIDFMRNNRTNTSVAAFSTRAREGAPVSVPLAWTELTSKLDPAAFTLSSVPARIDRQKKDPWAGYFTMKQVLPSKGIAALQSLHSRARG